MSEKESVINTIAEAVTKRIFDMGAELGNPCHRIEFKVYYRGIESGAGGLARDPFKKYVRDAVDSSLSTRLAAMEKREANLVGMLQECAEYFEDRADVVDGSYGEPAPNKEMAILSAIRSALQGATNGAALAQARGEQKDGKDTAHIQP